MKKTLIFILDWIVILITIPLILLLLNIDNFSTSWKTPIFLNLSTLLIMIYVQYVHENKAKRFNTIKDYANFLLSLNIIAFVSQLTIGIYKKYDYSGPIVMPLWKIVFTDAIEIILVYFIIILFLYFLSRKK